jgi:hypothetical protein
MKSKLHNSLSVLALLALFTLNSALSTARAQGTAFTYSGQLQDSGSPASGTYDLAFTLFTNSTGGVAVAGPVTNNAVGVTNGLFMVLIDFGPGVFTGQTDWLQIGVATNGDSRFTILSPRQQLTPTPYALFASNAAVALTATTASNAVSATFSGSATTAAFFFGFTVRRCDGNAKRDGGCECGRAIGGEYRRWSERGRCRHQHEYRRHDCPARQQRELFSRDDHAHQQLDFAFDIFQSRHHLLRQRSSFVW